MNGKLFIGLGMFILLSINVMGSPTNVSLPTTYNSYIVTPSFVPDPNEDPLLLEIGEEDASFFRSTSDAFLTVNTSLLTEITVDTVWSYLNVHAVENGGSSSRAFANNGSAYVYGMNISEVRARTTDLEYAIVNSGTPTGLKVDDLGSDAVSNLTSSVTNGLWSVALEESASADAGDEYSDLNSTSSDWESHILIQYDCQPPASGLWWIRVPCNIHNENVNVPGDILLSDDGHLKVTGTSNIQFTGMSQKIRIRSGAKITIADTAGLNK